MSIREPLLDDKSVASFNGSSYSRSGAKSKENSPDPWGVSDKKKPVISPFSEAFQAIPSRNTNPVKRSSILEVVRSINAKQTCEQLGLGEDAYDSTNLAEP